MSVPKAIRSWFSGDGGRARVLLVAIAIACIAILVSLPSPMDSLGKIREAKEAGERSDWKSKILLGEWLAAAVNLVIAGALALLARCWAKPLSAPEKPSFPARRRAPRWFWPMVLAAVVLAGTLRLNLARKSLWWDELWNVKQATHGITRTATAHPDKLKFYASDWARCAWYYQKPTNHAAIALASKASLSVWRTFTDAPEDEFSDFFVRLPALLAALLSVAMAAWVFKIWGMPGVGVVAAILLAIHPYHIRYGVDVRAYTLLVLATLMALAGFSKMFQRSKDGEEATPQNWFPWVLFGAGQFLLVWASVLVGAICASFFFLAASILILAGWGRGSRMTAFFRLIAVNAFAAMAFLQVFTPNILQFEDALSSDNVNRPLTMERLETTASQFLTGMEPNWGDGDDSEGLVSLADRGGWLFAGAVALLALAGLNMLAVKRRAALLPLGATALAAVAYLAYSQVSGLFYYHRFLIFFYTALTLITAAGIAGISCLASKQFKVRAAVSAGILALFFWAVWPQVALLNTRPYAPLRDVSEYVEDMAKGDPDSITAVGYGLGGRIIQTYNPNIIWASKDSKEMKEADFASAIDSAKSSDKPFYVIAGYRAFNLHNEPWGYRYLDDENLFETIETFRGIEPNFTFRILRLKKQ